MPVDIRPVFCWEMISNMMSLDNGDE